MSLTNSFINLLTNLISKAQMIKTFIKHGKTLNQCITSINLKFHPQLGMTKLICLMDLIQFLIFKITLTENYPIQVYPNKVKNGIVFQIKTGYKLELLSPETVKLLGSTKTDFDKDKDGEDVSKLESVEVVLVLCNLVNNSYQQASKVRFTFVSNKQIGLLITISPHLLTMLKTANSEFQSIQL